MGEQNCIVHYMALRGVGAGVFEMFKPWAVATPKARCSSVLLSGESRCLNLGGSRGVFWGLGVFFVFFLYLWLNTGVQKLVKVLQELPAPEGHADVQRDGRTLATKISAVCLFFF